MSYLPYKRALPPLERAAPPPGEEWRSWGIANMAHPIHWQCLQGCAPGQILTRRNKRPPWNSPSRSSDSRPLTIKRSTNAKCRVWILRAYHNVSGPRKRGMARSWCIFKTSEWLMLPPQGEELAERITRSTCQPIREAGTDHNGHEHSRSTPNNSLQGQRASPNWEQNSSWASFAGLLDSLKGLWSFIYVTGSTFWIDSSDHMSHHS